MEFLHSNYMPVQTGASSFLDMFYKLLSRTKKLDIAVGYITSESLAELHELVKQNDLAALNLTIGMHYLENFTRVQYNTAKKLNDYLLESGKGQVRLVTPFRYHGKIYSYSDGDGAFAGIIGSNNLGSIVEGGSRIYETSVLIDDRTQAEAMRSFIKQLNRDATENINDCDIHQFNENNRVLENHENVIQATPEEVAECLASLTEISFEIPVKGAEITPQSNLNAFFGKGRKSPNGLVKPRHWYEAEIIVPKSITVQPGYPVAQTEDAVFQVITDDGWKFSCKVSGQDNKNLRSEGDLKILGKWLKGRLENAGALEVGTPVTSDTLRQYGRDTFTLTKTALPNIWYLDFGVK